MPRLLTKTYAYSLIHTNAHGFPLAFLTAVCQYVDMVCIYCDNATQVTNSRSQKGTNQVWRRRSCMSCGNAFTTHEVADLSTALVVQYSDRDLRPFSRDMLFAGIYESCRHRSSAAQDAGSLTQTVVALLRPHIAEGTILRKQIVLITSEVLARFDPTAAAVYTAFHKA